MADIAPERDLLFGLLALQNGLIDQVQLVAAFQAWTRRKDRALADHLVGRGDLEADDRSAVEALVIRHLRKHGGDAERSLAAVAAGRSTRESLAALGDADIEQTLARTAPDTGDDADRTATYAVGTATADGQRFRVLRPHARGGLGAVFVALDAELHREVALKQILDGHADDPVSRQRFVQEAEITGGLEHPGIVPVYGLGTHGDGRPYYAMRFIRGDSLKEAVDRFHADPSLRSDPGRRSLGLRKLLRRFTDVCNAIEYAHSRGVLHRDLKPGNIIVGKHGETLVVDWGLAKATGRSEPGAGERTLVPSSSRGSAETLPGAALGTPAYMSPEQAEGDLDHLGPRSDVYSLGATLFYLLIGKPPFEGDVGDVLRKVQRGDFPPPRRLDPTLDPALEAVCLKAMALKPEDRHASCRALAEDVERWMADEPVSAYREPVARRARRWARRHRTAVTAAAVALVAGTFGLAAVLAVQTRARSDLARSLARETKANADLAAANAELTRSKAAVQARYNLAVDAIKTFHTGVSEDFLLKQDQFKDLRNRLLKTAADFYGKLSALLGQETDPSARRALAAAYMELAVLTNRIGRAEDALATYRRAEAILEDQARTDPEARAALATSRSRRGYLLYQSNKFDDALAAYRQARADLEALAEAPKPARSARRELAKTLLRLGELLADTNRPKQAEVEHRAALAIRQALADEDPASPVAQSDLADSHSDLGNVLAGLGRAAEAESHLRAGLDLYRRAAAADPRPFFSQRLADGHRGLGNLLLSTDRTSAAEAEFRAAQSSLTKLVHDYPADTEYRWHLAQCQKDLGTMLARTGKIPEAEADFRAALGNFRKLTEENPSVERFRYQVAAGHHNVAWSLLLSGRLADAEAEYRQAIALMQPLAVENPAATVFRADLAGSHNDLGELLARTGRKPEAADEQRAAYEIYRRLAAEEPGVPLWRRRVGMCHTNLGNSDLHAGRPEAALDHYRESRAIHERLVREHPETSDYRIGLSYALNGLGDALHRCGQGAEAVEAVRQAAAALESVPDPRIEARYHLAVVYALLAKIAADPGSGLSASERESAADRALAALRDTVARGYRDVARIRDDPELASIRGRPDFQLLVMDLAFPAHPFASAR